LELADGDTQRTKIVLDDRVDRDHVDSVVLAKSL